MADDLSNRGGQDRKRIDVHQDHELRDWSAKFGVTPDELKEAVQAVGTNADKVGRYLQERRSSRPAGERGTGPRSSERR